jgi:hypothetical protein
MDLLFTAYMIDVFESLSWMFAVLLTLTVIAMILMFLFYMFLDSKEMIEAEANGTLDKLLLSFKIACVSFVINLIGYVFIPNDQTVLAMRSNPVVMSEAVKR